MMQEEMVYGLFPEFQAVLSREAMGAATERLAGMQEGLAAEWVGAVPREWEVDDETRRAWVAMLTRRAQLVAANLQSWLWPE
jgi:hypothetical protein